jgi:cytochrome bd-type quinol oxidase subunit 2
MNVKTLSIILVAIAILLSIPLIVMQFNDNVRWSIFDFLIMAVLLFVTSTACVLVLKKVSDMKYRIAIILIIIIAFLLIWAEIGVGIFGTPFAGS